MNYSWKVRKILTGDDTKGPACFASNIEEY